MLCCQRQKFFFNSRSAATVASTGQKNQSFAVSEQKLLIAPIICEVRQMYLKKESEALFKVFNNKIYKASKKVQENFTLDNIQRMFYFLENALTNQCFTGYYKYNLNILLSTPCFLLYCYSHLKIKKAVNTNAIFIENVTLSTFIYIVTFILGTFPQYFFNVTTLQYFLLNRNKSPLCEAILLKSYLQ